MPSSFAEGKQTIVEWLTEIKPNTALDIGPGCGTYQYLVSGRYGEIVNVKDETGKRQWNLGLDASASGEFVDYEGPPCNVIGIEAYYPYVNRFKLKDRYKQVIISDIQFVDWNKVSLLNFGTLYDVGFCGDVLEHLSIAKAKELFDWLELLCKHVIVSIPIVHFPQEEFEGNPFEKHMVDDWSHEKFIKTFGRPHKFFTGNHIGVYWYKTFDYRR